VLARPPHEALSDGYLNPAVSSTSTADLSVEENCAMWPAALVPTGSAERALPAQTPGVPPPTPPPPPPPPPPPGKKKKKKKALADRLAIQLLRA